MTCEPVCGGGARSHGSRKSRALWLVGDLKMSFSVVLVIDVASLHTAQLPVLRAALMRVLRDDVPETAHMALLTVRHRGCVDVYELGTQGRVSAIAFPAFADHTSACDYSGELNGAKRR